MIENFLPTPGPGRARHTMWRHIKAVHTVVIGLLFAACTDSRAPTVTAPQADARTETGTGVVSTAAHFDPGVPLAYYQLSLVFSKRTGGFTPPVQARAFGYMGLALYEAVIAGMPDHRSVASQLNGIGALPQANPGIPYNWPLVANAALAEVMRGLWGDQTNRASDNIADLNTLEANLALQYGAGVPPGIAKLSIDFGRSVGAAVYATSRDDGGDRSYLTNFPTSYTPPSGPAFWVPLTGQVAMQPFWAGTVGTFALSSAAECNPGPPPAYSEDPNSAFYGEANFDYQLSKTLTPEQITIARYWADGPGTISGPGHSLAIVNEIVTQQNANLAQAAEAYARAGIADADALTAIWQSKYQYNLIRPVTYIRRVIDPTWNALLPTPPFPEYVSAHSGQSAAVATTLETLFGTNVSFDDHAHDGDGFASRHFDHIFAAAEEAGISRIYAGIHFQSGNLNGQALGRCVAARVNSLSWRG
jgi:hypothetical protein